MSIGYANICSSVQNIDKMLYLYKVLEEQKRAKESTKRKLGAPEKKCSWSSSAPEVMTSSEASSPEAEELKDSKVGISFNHA